MNCLFRIDLERVGMSAEIQSNFMPRVLGSMMLRPGLKFIDTMFEDLRLVRQMPFVFGVDDTALLEFGAGSYLRIRIADVLLERVDVIATVTDSSFNAPLGVGAFDWQDNSGSGSTAVSGTGILQLVGSGETYGRVSQRLAIDPGEVLVDPTLGLNVLREFCTFRLGSTPGDDNLIPETKLGKGSHNLAFIPNSNDVYIQLSNDRLYEVQVANCTIQGAGPVTFGTGWSTDDQVASVRWAQSGDVIYTAADGLQQKRIERRGYIEVAEFKGRSKSLVDYGPEDGPFNVLNPTATTIETDAIVGDAILTASDPIFQQVMGGSVFGAGAIFRLTSQGQVVTDMINAEATFTNPIRVTGSGEARRFGIIVENIPPGSGTVTVQFSIGSATGPWNDLTPQYTSNISTTYLDQQDNQIIFYRIGVKAGDFTSGPITVTLSFTGGSITGVARMHTWIDSTHIGVNILQPFGSLDATKDWYMGQWNGGTTNGWPDTVDIHENRLWWAGLDRIWGSVSDDYESFDDETEGDSGPINRNIGSGPIRTINWLKSFGRLLIGTSENSADIDSARMDGNHPLGVRSSSFDEALTPTNFNIKTIASKGVFVDRTKQRLYELSYNADSVDYMSADLSIYTPDFNVVGIRQIAVQMKPDIRVHCVRLDGTVGVLVYDRVENVIAWVDVVMGGPGNWKVQDVAVLPGTVEDQVYYTVEGFNSVTNEERYLLKWSMESEAIGGDNSYLVDSWGQYIGAPTALITGVERLAGLFVSIWADGADKGTVQVSQFGSPGEIDLSGLDGQPFSNVVYGLPYTAQFKSAKLGSIQGIGLLERKKVNRLGFIGENLHYQGLQYVLYFTQLYDMPLVEQGQITTEDFIWEDYHEDNFSFGGEWRPDSRICIQAASPRPATLLAAIAEFESVEQRSNRGKNRNS